MTKKRKDLFFVLAAIFYAGVCFTHISMWFTLSFIPLPAAAIYFRYKDYKHGFSN